MTVSPSQAKKRGGCLLLLLASLGLFQILLVFRVLEDTAIYGELSFPPALQIGLSSLWLVIIIWVGQVVVRKQSYGLGYTTISAYFVMRLLQNIFFAEADYDRNRIPFLLLVMVSLLLIPLLRWFWRSGTQNERG